MQVFDLSSASLDLQGLLCSRISSQEVDCADESLQSHVSSAVKRLHNAMKPCHTWNVFTSLQDLPDVGRIRHFKPRSRLKSTCLQICNMSALKAVSEKTLLETVLRLRSTASTVILLFSVCLFVCFFCSFGIVSIGKAFTRKTLLTFNCCACFHHVFIYFCKAMVSFVIDTGISRGTWTVMFRFSHPFS